MLSLLSGGLRAKELEYDDEEKAHRELVWSIYEGLNLPEEKAVAIYTPQYNPEKSFTVIPGEINSDNIDKINAYQTQLCDQRFETTMFDSYHFIKGNVFLEHIMEDSIATELRAESEETGEDPIIRELEVSDVPSHVRYRYLKDDGKTEISIDIRGEWGGLIHRDVEGMDDIIESVIVQVGGIDVLYENTTDGKTVDWVSDGIGFSLRTTNTDITQAEMLSITEQIIKQYSSER